MNDIFIFWMTVGFLAILTMIVNSQRAIKKAKKQDRQLQEKRYNEQTALNNQIMHTLEAMEHSISTLTNSVVSDVEVIKNEIVELKHYNDINDINIKDIKHSLKTIKPIVFENEKNIEIIKK